MASEFELIRRYFNRPQKNTLLGIGDDCALVNVREGMALAISTDMLVSGTHFFSDVDPFSLGHKVLAVNLSDMAAMGAYPRWCTLAIALPNVNEAWIGLFASGFFALADRFDVALIGGDMTRGPLNFCVQIMGEVLPGKALKRNGANVDDDIWVSGNLGDAALMLKHLQQKIVLTPQMVQVCSTRLHKPEPRIALGLALRNLANSCVDISDGLVSDLGHILEASEVGADINLVAIPQSVALNKYDDESLRRQCLLAGGDDYELCFTASPDKRHLIEALSDTLELRITRIGFIKKDPGLLIRDEHQNILNMSYKGFDHFA